jgi:hypothetical protein
LARQEKTARGGVICHSNSYLFTWEFVLYLAVFPGTAAADGFWQELRKKEDAQREDAQTEKAARRLFHAGRTL